jgi:hypothetical protein
VYIFAIGVGHKFDIRNASPVYVFPSSWGTLCTALCNLSLLS